MGASHCFIRSQFSQAQMWYLLDCEGHTVQKSQNSTVGWDLRPQGEMSEFQVKVKNCFNFPLTCERRNRFTSIIAYLLGDLQQIT